MYCLYQDLNDFFRERKSVLEFWRTGSEVDLEEGIEYQRKLPYSKRFSSRLLEFKKNDNTAVQPRSGVATLEEQIKLLKRLKNEGNADFLSTTIDSYTRQNRYSDAEYGLCESEKSGKSLLNGYPLVNYGVYKSRKIIEELDRPVQVRHGTPDARLLAEISFAAGFSSFEGGPISYCIPYSKHYSLSDCIDCWEYVDTLAGIYTSRGAVINREFFGPLTGTLVPPCISIVVNILEALLAAKAGVKDISVGYGQNGNIIQDVAAMIALKDLTKEYLSRFGFLDINLTTVFHQWMGAFPEDKNEALGIIAIGALAAKISGATKVITKTADEALGVPTADANIQGLRVSKQAINLLKAQNIMANLDISEELEIIKQEVKAILEAVFNLNNNLKNAIVKAFEDGVIDVPFAPNIINAGRVLPARDMAGMVRFLEFGNIPLSDRIKDIHRKKIANRYNVGRYMDTITMIIEDINSIRRGFLVKY